VTVRNADPAMLDRSRDFVGGFHESDLPARALVVPGLPPGCEAKTLSRDPLGESTQLVRIPAGWRSGRGSFAAATDLFVVSGRLQFDGRPLRAMTHVAVPAGAAGRYSAPIDTVVLVHAAGPLSFGEGARTEGGVVVDTEELDWEPAEDPGLPAGLMVKRVHGGDDAGPSVWLMAAVHWGRRARWQRHPVAEEGFLLEGEMAAAVALKDGVRVHRYQAGGYFHRPGRTPHLVRTAGSMLLLMRSAGPLTTEWRDDPWTELDQG
jgi:Domain of unknown function (DUF4437)